YREWRASGGHSPTLSTNGPHPRWPVFTSARVPGDTVAIAQSFDWSKSRRVIATRRLADGCFAIRRTGIEDIMLTLALGFHFRARPIRHSRVRRAPGARRIRPDRAHTAGSAPGEGLPGPLGRPDTTDAPWVLVLQDRGPREGTGLLELGGLPEAAGAGLRQGHLLRDKVDEARHAVARRERRRPSRAGRGRPARRLRDRLLRRRIHDQRPAPGAHQRPGFRGVPVRRQTAGTGAWRSGASGRPPPLFLEEREMGSRPARHGAGRAWILGVARVQ